MEVRTKSEIGAGFVALTIDGQPVAVPGVIYAEVVDAPWNIAITVTMNEQGRPDMESVAITRKAGGPAPGAFTVHGVKLGEAVRLAVDSAALKGQRLTAGGPNAFIYSGTAGPGGMWVGAAVAGESGVGRQLAKRRKPRVTVEDVRAAADAYSKLVSSGFTGDTYAEVARVLSCSRATVGRRLDKARELGILGGEA